MISRAVSPWRIAAIALIFALGLVALNLAPFAWNPSAMIRFGEYSADDLRYARDLLGADVISTAAGHDGKFFFAQAMDPLYLHPTQHAVHLDFPRYRAQRMLYPMLAGGFGLMPPVATAWGLISVNVVALSFGSLATAKLCKHLGVTPWLGLAFALNIGLINELNIDGSGIVATAALMSAVLATEKQALRPTVAALTAAVLARETMLIGVLGLALWWWLRIDRRAAVWVMSSPAMAGALWFLYISLRLPGDTPEMIRGIGMPFVGLIRSVDLWLADSDRLIEMLLAAVILIAGLRLTIEAFRRPSPLAWAVSGFVVLAVIMAEQVWYRYYDFGRALAPLLTGYVIVVGAFLTTEGRSSELSRQEGLT